jgi:hypothetical protein
MIYWPKSHQFQTKRNNLKSLYDILERMNWSEIPYHPTVPLIRYPVPFKLILSKAYSLVNTMCSGFFYMWLNLIGHESICNSIGQKILF